MAYKALYRTYRPTTFDEVAGQEHIVRTLRNALATNKIAHAYLFCGPRGTGKTTMAKLLAKALNCEEGQGHQCNHCSNCLAINDGSHPDVIEIDAASNNGVEDVRDIIERVKYSPIKGKYKVYIIDEVHMMSPNAFNALLKTLEEPPANVIFILATTEPHKVLPTILSRCQRYDFSKVDNVSIEKRMELILQKEAITYEDKALKLIVSLSDGGVRDALSLLDQAIAYCGNRITCKDVEDIFGLISIEEIVKLMTNIYKGNINVVLDDVNALISHGTDIRRLTQDILEVCKDIVIYNKIQEEKFLVKLSKEQALKLCNMMTSEEAIEMIDILMKAQAEFKVVNNIKSLFEVTLLKLTMINTPRGDKVMHEEVKQEVKPQFYQPLEDKEASKPMVEEVKVESTISSTPVVEEPAYNVEEKVEAQQEVKEEPQVEVKEVVPEEPIKEPIKEEQPHEEVKDDILQSDELPPFMVEQEQIKDEEKDLVVPEMVTVGEPINVSDEDIIKLMVLGNKNAKLKLIDSWSKLQNLILVSKYAKYASQLRDGKPFILTKDILILQYEHEFLVKKVNIKENQDIFKKIIEKISDLNVRVYAITRVKAVELYHDFQDLYQAHKLPKVEEIKIDFKF